MEKPKKSEFRKLFVLATPLKAIGEAWEKGKEYSIRVCKYTRGFAIFKTPGDREHPNQWKQPSGHKVYSTIESMMEDFNLTRMEVEITTKS